MLSRKLIVTLALLIGTAALYGGWLAYLAHRDLVTLNVRNMDVRTAVKKVERQTWEDIFVDKGVEGKVTLQVRRMPLSEVLRRIADQTFSRSSSIYPLYSNEKSLETLKQALRGEVDPAEHGWTNLQSRFAPGGPGGMPGFGMMAMGRPGPGQEPAEARRVSLNISGKDLSFATLAFNRFAQARVVPEDGTSALINLTLKQAPVRKAVSKLARAAHRKWTRVYALQPMFEPGGPRGPQGPGEMGGPSPFAFRGDGPRSFPRSGGEMSTERRDEMRQQREALEEELKQALPAEERQKVEREQQERQQMMQEMANLTPEQRRERMPMPNAAEMSRMQRERVLNSTPEQRAQMNQRRNQMRPPGPPR
jgi:hypothetical protein